MPTAISVLTLPPQIPDFTHTRAPDHNEVHYGPTMWEMFYQVPADPGRHIPQPHVDLDLGPLHDIATMCLP